MVDLGSIDTIPARSAAASGLAGDRARRDRHRARHPEGRKEADVFLLRRGVPDTDRSCLLAAKRYRSAEHRMFHRDSEYLEGRRVRESRDSRAMANRTAIGRQMIAVQWANAEFSALCQLHLAGVPVP